LLLTPLTGTVQAQTTHKTLRPGEGIKVKGPQVVVSELNALYMSKGGTERSYQQSYWICLCVCDSTFLFRDLEVFGFTSR